MTPIDSGGGLCDLWRREGPMRKVKPEVAAGLLREWEASGEPTSSWCTRRGLSWYSLSAFKGWGVRPQRSRSPRSSSRDFRADTLQRLLVAVAAC